MIPHDQKVATPEEMCEEILWTAEQITARGYELAKEIWLYYQTEKIYQLHTITVLEGASRTRDLILGFIQQINEENPNCPPLVCHEDSVMISSYKDGFNSSRKPKIILMPKFSTEKHHILIIEDIIDTGTAMSCFLHDLSHFTKKPASIKMCTLVDKPINRYPETRNIKTDFVGFTLKKDLFVVGFGLDYKHYYRNLPYIMAIKDEFKKIK